MSWMELRESEKIIEDGWLLSDKCSKASSIAYISAVKDDATPESLIDLDITLEKNPLPEPSSVCDLSLIHI